jgi:GNAT superfamily N-acetyltransferase
MFADLALSRRLEGAEAFACRQFAEARRRLFPDSGAAWMQCAGAWAVFDTVDSPATQTFGLGVFEELTDEALDTIERFFLDRGAPVVHEVSPFAGVAALDLLCARSYRPFEIGSVLYRTVERPAAAVRQGVTAREIRPEEAPLWSEISARGWTHGRPELQGVLLEFGAMIASRAQSPCFLGEVDGQPGAAGALCIHEGVALFAGASTVPDLRRRGLQGALLEERMSYALDHGCDLAMMVAEAGGESQRNAERQGFRVAYTRLKWRLST